VNGINVRVTREEIAEWLDCYPPIIRLERMAETLDCFAGLLEEVECDPRNSLTMRIAAALSAFKGTP
jgi:hypothetical protein